MANQGSSLGWQPANGGGGAAEPFDKVYAKTRRWRTMNVLNIPAGAMVIDCLNTGLVDITVTVSGGSAETLKPGMRFNFVGQQNPADQTFELSKAVTITPGAEEIDIFVMYPASSLVDPNLI